MSTGLSDALSRMAGGDAPKEAKKKRSPAPPRSVPLDDDVILGELDEPEYAPGPAPAPAPGPGHTARSSPRPSVRRNANHGLKAAAVPVLITVGALLLVPGVWSLLILSGTWQSPREDARTMAVAMLATWPIAASMFAGAGFFWWQIRRK